MQQQVKEISLEEDDLFEEFELEGGNMQQISKDTPKTAESLWEADWNDEKEKVPWATRMAEQLKMHKNPADVEMK